MENKKLILGSQSVGKQQILKEAGYKFETMSADIDEKQIRHENPEKMVLALARAKAKALLPKINEQAILITTDTFVMCNGKIFEKPKDEKEAKEFIRCYAKHPMETLSSIVVTDTISKKSAEGVDVTKVYFKEIPDEVINDQIKNGRVMQCAGGMNCQDKPFIDYVDHIDGTFDSATGMPLKLLQRLLKEIGDN